MTVPSQDRRAGPYLGNGVTVDFAYGFIVVDQAHLKVIKRGVDGVETVLTDYTVSGVGSQLGGNVTLPTAPIVGETIVIIRDVPFVQETDLENQGAYYAETVEQMLDLSVMRDQQLQEQIDRSIVFPASDDASNLGTLIAGVVALSAITDDITTVARVSGSVTTLAAIAPDVAELTENIPVIVAAADEAVAAEDAAEAARDEALARTNLVAFAANRAALALLDGATYQSVDLMEAGIKGIFHWSSSDLSAEVTADTRQAIYVAPTSDATGASGAWVRVFNGAAQLDWWRPGADASAAMQAAGDFIASAGVPLELPQMYRCDSNVTITAPNKTVVITGDGGLDFSQGVGRLTITGAAERIQNLNADIAIGDPQMWLTSDVVGVVPGSVVALWNPTAGSWMSSRDYYTAGEFLRVYAVSTNRIQFYGRLSDSYTAAATQVWRIDPVRVRMSNVMIKESPSQAVGCRVTFGVDVVLDHVRGMSVVSTGIELDRCYGVDVIAPVVLNNSPFVNDEYAVVFANCQNFTYSGGNSGATRHTVAIGGGTGDCSFVNRFGHINNATLMNFNGSAEAADMHGNCEFIEYNNCNLVSGMGAAGQNITYRGCRAWSHSDGASGYIVLGREIRGGLFKFIDCDFFISGNMEAKGAIFIQPNVDNEMRQDLDIYISGCTLKGAGSAAGLAIQIDVRPGSNLKKVNLRVQNTMFDIDQLLALIYIRLEGGGALPTDYIIADGVIWMGAPATYTIYPDATISGATKFSRRIPA